LHAFEENIILLAGGSDKGLDYKEVGEAIAEKVGTLILCGPTSEKIEEATKNALVKQYKKLLELDEVELEFEQEALEAIVDKAIERKTGARGLRAIIEEIMRDIMFELPSNPKIEKCIITKETVETGEAPKVIINNNREAAKKTPKKRVEATPKTTSETA